DRQTILDSFQPYYEVTSVTEETDVNHLYDLKARLDEFQIYCEQEIHAFTQVYFDPDTRFYNPGHSKGVFRRPLIWTIIFRKYFNIECNTGTDHDQLP